jgi:hypothetical protein
MTLISFSKAMLVTLALGLVTLPSVSTAAFARPLRSLELVNRPSSPDYGRDTYNYDRAVNGSTASTPGAN